MSAKNILLALLMVLSVSAVWVTPVAAAPKDDVFYRPMEVTPDMLADIPFDYDSLPEGVGVAGAASDAAAADGPSTADAVVGDVRWFYALDLVNGYYLKPFELRAVGQHGEVWVAIDFEDAPNPFGFPDSGPGLDFPDGDPRNPVVVTQEQIDYLLNEFDETIYPVESEVFGEPAARDGSASVLGPDYHQTDGEGRAIILIDNVRDEGYYDSEYPLYVAGFYSPVNQALFDRNIVTVDAYDWAHRVGTEESPWWPDGEPGVENLYEGTFAHEYQHLIHGDLDADETTWLNEGMSDLSEYLVGYGHPMGHVNAFLEAPDNSLVQWEDQGPTNVLRDYGHTYMFHLYLYEQYGEEFVTKLAQSESNGIAAVEETMADEGVEGDFYTLYQDFSTALAVDGTNKPTDPRYEFQSIDFEVNLDVGGGTVGAYGSAFETIDARGEGPIQSVSVEGIDLLGTDWEVVSDPVDGQDALYSGLGNQVDRFAIFEADLTGTSTPTLSFDTRYEIEAGWDYGFVQVSTDGGETWTSLTNAGTTSVLADPETPYPTIDENLPGLTGSSGGWTTTEFDLSAYAGQDVLVAFRYVTDWAFNTEGWYVRNVAVSETGISLDGTDASQFLSLREATDDYVEYQFTFLGIRGDGRYDVLQLDLRTFDAAAQQELREFFEGTGTGPGYRDIQLVVSFAPDSETGSVVPYGYEVTFVEKGERDNAPGRNR